METLKKYWAYITAAVGAIIGLIMLKDFFQKDLKAEVKLTDTKIKDASLEAEKTVIDNKVEDLESANQKAQDDLEKAKADAAKASNTQIEDFYKNNK